MDRSNRVSRAFYQQLARLFYAIAATDGKVRKEEIAELKKIIKNEWLSLDPSFDEYGIDYACYILITFDWLHENHWDIKQVIPEFKIYMKNNEDLFTDSINQLIFRTSSAIASAFDQRNKSELVFLCQLDMLLNKKAQHSE